MRRCRSPSPPHCQMEAYRQFDRFGGRSPNGRFFTLRRDLGLQTAVGRLVTASSRDNERRRCRNRESRSPRPATQ